MTVSLHYALVEPSIVRDLALILVSDLVLELVCHEHLTGERVVGDEHLRFLLTIKERHFEQFRVGLIGDEAPVVCVRGQLVDHDALVVCPEPARVRVRCRRSGPWAVESHRDLIQLSRHPLVHSFKGKLFQTLRLGLVEHGDETVCQRGDARGVVRECHRPEVAVVTVEDRLAVGFVGRVIDDLVPEALRVSPLCGPADPLGDQRHSPYIIVDNRFSCHRDDAAFLVQGIVHLFVGDGGEFRIIRCFGIDVPEVSHVPDADRFHGPEILGVTDVAHQDVLVEIDGLILLNEPAVQGIAQGVGEGGRRECCREMHHLHEGHAELDAFSGRNAPHFLVAGELDVCGTE